MLNEFSFLLLTNNKVNPKIQINDVNWKTRLYKLWETRFFYIKFNLFSFHIQNESICDFIFKKYVNFHFSKVKVTPDNTISDT